MPSLNLRNPLRRDPNRPTLKQRAAALKATAGRIIRKPKPLPAAGSPEAMALHKAVCTEFDRRTHLTEDQYARLRMGSSLRLWTADTVRAVMAGDFSSLTGDEVYAAAKVSPAELRELLVLTLRRELVMEEATHDLRLYEVHALAFPDDQTAADGIEATEGDPAVDAIRHHKAAYAAWLPHLVRTSEADGADPRKAEWEKAAEEPYEREQAAYEALFEVLPTTTEGLAALADYLPGAVLRNGVSDASNDALTALGAMCGAVAHLASHERSDAELIALGQRFDALHALWREADEAEQEPAARRDAALEEAKARGGPTIEDIRAAWALPGVDEAVTRADKAYGALEPITRQIAAVPARTIQGLAVKARTLIPAVWPLCDYEQNGRLGEDEDWTPQVVRWTIEACCSAAGVDWRGQPQGSVPASTKLPADIAGDLLRDLEECDRLRAPLAGQQDDTPEDSALYHRQWDLLERIDALPPGSPSALRAKARAGLIALKWDDDASNTGSGSFLSLATQVVKEVADRPDNLPVRTQNSAPEA